MYHTHTPLSMKVTFFHTHSYKRCTLTKHMHVSYTHTHLEDTCTHMYHTHTPLSMKFHTHTYVYECTYIQNTCIQNTYMYRTHTHMYHTHTPLSMECSLIHTHVLHTNTCMYCTHVWKIHAHTPDNYCKHTPLLFLQCTHAKHMYA